MNPSADPDLASAQRVYAGLTRAYPHSFRRAYGPLMLQLFCDQYRAARATPGRGEMARFWLRTLGDLAASVLSEQADELRRVTMNQERMSSTVLGVLLFALMGTAVLLMDAPVPNEVYSLVNTGGIVLWFCGYLLVLGLLLKGWLAGFPRWVYPYLGYAFIFPLYIALVTTPDFAVFGIPVWGKEQWGWRACVPLGVMVLLGLRLSRPLGGNLARLVRNVWEDWTLAVFTLFGLLPMVFFISLDEVERSFAFWPKLAGIAIILAGVFLYMRLAHPRLRFLLLLGCALLAVAVMVGSSHYYWQTHDVNITTGVRVPRAGPVDWGALLYEAASQAGCVLVVLLLPVPLALARRIYMWLQSRRPSLP